MPIITQTDKRSGITYAYETTYYWDKEKQQSRAKRTCIGKVDPDTGNIIPTRGRSKKKAVLDPTLVKPGPTAYTESRHLYYGATYLLETLANNLGLRCTGSRNGILLISILMAKILFHQGAVSFSHPLQRNRSASSLVFRADAVWRMINYHS